MATGVDLAALLQHHVPVLRYDSQEPYYADAASEWTDNPGNALRRADGTAIAGGGGGLSLGFLDPTRYANGDAVAHDDRIADPGHDYVAQARAMHAQVQYANRVYGHWETGRDGHVWLAYWFFYFYNDYNLIGPLIKAGLHEGDWEMIQLRLDPAGQVPEVAVYAQHRHAAQRPWSGVERVGDQPVVYPARGSHACYFSAGVHWTGDWFDFADGHRPAAPLALEVISDAPGADGWATWPGMWGGTQPPADSINPLDDSSPRGPGGHAQYRQPDTLLATAAAHEAAVAAAPPAPSIPAAPTVTAAARGDDLHIAYDTHADHAAGLVVTIGDPRAPGSPAVHRIPIDAASGTITIPGAAAGGPQTVSVSVATQDSAASPATRALATTN